MDMKRAILVLTASLTLTACMSHRACLPVHDHGDGFEPVEGFNPAGRNFPLYKIGSGPPVILLHELPGMSGEDMRLAHMLADKHFTVYMPLFFGDVGESSSRNALRATFDGDFHPFARHEASRAVEWVRGLGAWISETKQPGSKVGVIGMCLTGNFPVPLARESWFGAGVMAQPALPYYSAALGVSDDDIKRVPANAVLLYYRFSDDRKSPPGKLEAYKKALPMIEEHELPSTCRPRTHSVLAEDFVPSGETQKAFDHVVEVLRDRRR